MGKHAYFLKQVAFIFTVIAATSMSVHTGPVWVIGHDSIYNLASDGTMQFRIASPIRCDPEYSAFSAGSGDGSLWYFSDTMHFYLTRIFPDGTTGFIQSTNQWLTGLSAATPGGSCWVGYYQDLRKYNSTGAVVLNLAGPGGIATAISGNAADGSCMVIIIRSYDQNSLCRVANDGTTQWEVTVPYGILLGVDRSDGSSWVCSANGQLFKYDSFGINVFSSSIGAGCYFLSVNAVDGSCWVALQQGLMKLNRDGSIAFTLPWQGKIAIAVSEIDSSCWVADKAKKEVVKISAQGIELGRFGGFTMLTNIAVYNQTVSSPAHPADIVASLFMDRLRPGFETNLQVSCGNVGDNPAQNVTLTLNLPSDATYISCTGSGIYSSATHSVCWTSSLLNGESGIYQQVHVGLPSSVPLGTLETSSAVVTTTTAEDDPSNNTAICTGTVVGSFDPNDKQVSPQGFISGTQWLTYVIDFENIGTAEAVNITVSDSLSDNLDPSSLTMISDQGSYDVSSRTIRWNFPGINLPPQGKGFVSFMIKPAAGLADGAQILNNALIRFDFNAPIATQQVVSIIGSPAECSDQKITDALNALCRDVKVSGLNPDAPLLSHLHNALRAVANAIILQKQGNKTDAAAMLHNADNQLSAIIIKLKGPGCKGEQTWKNQIITRAKEIKSLIEAFIKVL